MARKTGVFICTGCEIGEAVEVEGLSKVAISEFKAPLCKSHHFLCSAEGVEMVRDELKGGELDSVLLGACSPRYHQDIFNFGKEYPVARVPLREYVSWSQPHQEEESQAMAEDYMRMHLASLRKQEPPEPFIQQTEYGLLVVGGGITGMTAALEAAKAGQRVELVEKEAVLGGFARRMKLRIPAEPPFQDPIPPEIEGLASQVEEHAGITIYLSSRIGSISGQPGDFSVRLLQQGGGPEFKVGAIVMATGGRPYDVSKLTHLGSALDNVISSVEFEEMAEGGGPRRKDGKRVRSVAFIQCAGSRDPDHLPYCSTFCCTTSLKQAAYLRELHPENKAYIFYREMMTPGRYENFYRERQADPGLFLTKGKVSGVRENEAGDIVLEVDETLLGEKLEVTVDLAVLALGMEPANRDDPILNLEYRQGPGLPEQQYGFPDSHFICFPYETRRTGIYTAGAARQPMDMNFAAKDAAGAAMKAIQSVALTALGQAVHPRVGDESYPVFQMDRCTQCKRCTEECPFGVLDEDEKGTPLLNVARCRRCGVCMGACPVRIISFKNYSVDSVGEMIKNVEIPDEFEEKPRILLFACENDAIPVFDMMAMHRLRYNPAVRIIPVRCLGSVNLVWVSDALSVGYDGIMFMGCKRGDDYQCHFIKGSELAGVRLSKVQETISRLNLESERVQQFEITMNDYTRLPAIINEFVEMIENFGPNPFKGL